MISDKLALVCLLGGSLMAQQTQERATTRQMYFAGLDAAAKAPAKPATKTSPTPAQPSNTTRPAPSSVPIVQVMNKVPLGLKYTMLRNASGQDTEVPSNTKFQSGERIRIRLEANDNGYLYVVNQGTSGSWQVIFPAKNVADGSNHVEAGKSYEFPSTSAWKFTGPAGVEKLFIVLSREPVKGLEELLYNLRGQEPEPTARPAQSNVMLAANLQVKNSLIDELRKTATRDLVLATDDDEPAQPASNKTGGVRIDHAVYVVNPTGSAAAKVVADVSLYHQ